MSGWEYFRGGNFQGEMSYPRDVLSYDVRQPNSTIQISKTHYGRIPLAAGLLNGTRPMPICVTS